MHRLLLSVLAFAACSVLLGAAPEAGPPTPLFSEHVSTTALGDEIYVSSYRLDLRPLQPGGAILLWRGCRFLTTWAARGPLHGPLLHVPPATDGVLNFSADVVDARTNRTVPLSQVYNHHFVVQDSSSPRDLANNSAFGRLLETRTSFNAGVSPSLSHVSSIYLTSPLQALAQAFDISPAEALSGATPSCLSCRPQALRRTRPCGCSMRLPSGMQTCILSTFEV